MLAVAVSDMVTTRLHGRVTANSGREKRKAREHRLDHLVNGAEVQYEYEEKGPHSRFCRDRIPVSGDASVWTRPGPACQFSTTQSATRLWFPVCRVVRACRRPGD